MTLQCYSIIRCSPRPLEGVDKTINACETKTVKDSARQKGECQLQTQLKSQRRRQPENDAILQIACTGGTSSIEEATKID
jgi:hypothetical protein